MSLCFLPETTRFLGQSRKSCHVCEAKAFFAPFFLSFLIIYLPGHFFFFGVVATSYIGFSLSSYVGLLCNFLSKVWSCEMI